MIDNSRYILIHLLVILEINYHNIFLRQKILEH